LVDFGENKASFALKAVEKAKMSGEYRSHIVNERRIMACVRQPFLVQYAGHWQTRSHLYLIMEYVDGQDLLSLLTQNGYFGRNVATFYLSEILVSLEYLHNLGIVYRDLKLENILVDLTGHIKIVDFGFSKKMVTSNTVCGTSDYLAPELFRGERYDKGVDWWAFGVLSYELRCGFTPFKSENPDPNKRYMEIEPKVMAMQLGKVEFPGDRQLKDDFKDLIAKLLRWKSSERLGVVAKVSDHQFFSRVNTGRVMRREYNPPIKVDQRNLDTNISFTVGDICFDEEFADF